jgi:hypothetical protein
VLDILDTVWKIVQERDESSQNRLFPASKIRFEYDYDTNDYDTYDELEDARTVEDLFEE